MDDASGNYSLMQTNNDFELHDFIDNPNLDQFVDLIREENNINDDLTGSLDYDLINGFSVDNQFGFDDTSCINNTTVSDLNIVFMNSLSSTLINGDVKERKEEEDNDEDDSSDTTTRKTKKTGRSRTLISERRRRGRMKEKLYALRALVPNITKMDKASIVGDAVLYVQELQRQAKKLKNEICGLEASLASSERYQESIESKRRNNNQVFSPVVNRPICKKIIMQMDVYQVEERGFYLRLVSNKEEGVSVSLYMALESLCSFNVQSSNLVTVPDTDRLVLTFTLNVRDSESGMNLPNLKLWVTGALLNQGFEVLTPFTA
ncbi:hypothetical protein LWI28_021783 [Acer negundo]|uniref:BHLH domain-containing protein n=1 Tax=Acer negundo TaxID=4023 RepID=A0AAD5JN27_ACENE|nr:hypothetical protein LWI28_021783 [Acer negundo]KAK4855216.1 hypothetical protein QYF36_005146 [Acer negundo]